MTRQSKIKRLGELFDFLVEDSADVYVMFVDLCGSTEYKQYCAEQRMPEITWITRQLLFLQRAAAFVKQHEGIIVKTVGDELMAIFQPSAHPDDILNCAIEILQSLHDFKAFQGNALIEAKVSIDFGPTYNGSLIDAVPYDPIGTPVDRCARLNSKTGKNEITFSHDFFSILLANTTEIQLRQKYHFNEGQESFKGIGTIQVYRIAAG
jgi:class 3 adenylate cyclase